MSNMNDFVIEDGVLKKYVGQGGDVVIPEGVFTIASEAFRDKKSVETVAFPSSVISIEEHAFSNMEKLREIVLPKHLQRLEKETFSHCTSLNLIGWPDDLKYIGEKCFLKTGIKNLEIPDTVEEVDHYAFAYIQAPYVVLPKTIKKIGVCVFAGAKTIEVFDTIDSDAKPAADYVDSANGRCNGILGMIGMSVMGIRDYKVSRNGYETYGFYNTHTIIVRSAADDSIKYSVIIPKSINRTVYCTYISSWGKNAEFNFSAIDAIFNALPDSFKVEYALNRLKNQQDITDGSIKRLINYVNRNAHNALAYILKEDDSAMLQLLASYGFVKKSTFVDRREQIEASDAIKCKAWILEWQRLNVSSSEQKKALQKELGTTKLTVADIRIIWTSKKSGDGLILTKYRGKETTAVVPDAIGKTPVIGIGRTCFFEYSDKAVGEFLREKLQAVVIPDSVKTIDDMAFMGCYALRSVRLPNDLKRLSLGLFSGCENLQVSIPESVEEINQSAFDGCAMEELFIPKNVRNIHAGAFGCCYKNRNGMPELKSFRVDPMNDFYKDIDGVLFNKDGTTLVRYPQAMTNEEYFVPDGVVTIAENAFAYCSQLKHLILPQTIRRVENNAFFACTSLQTIKMPNSMDYLSNAFFLCDSLLELVIPEGITVLEDSTFQNCSSLKNVSLPNGLKKIGQMAFANCSSLTEITIPDSVRGIGECAFENCTALKKAIAYKGVTGLGWNVFMGCKNCTVYAPSDSKIYIYAQKAKLKVEVL